MSFKASVIKGFCHLILYTLLTLPFFYFVLFVPSEPSLTMVVFKGLGLFVMALIGTSGIVGKDKLHSVGLIFQKFVDAIKPVQDGMVDKLVKHKHAIYCVTFLIFAIILVAVGLLIRTKPDCFTGV